MPDPEDPASQVNTGLITTLETADIILVAGEASSHCVANTLLDTLRNFSDPKYAQRMFLLRDCMSPVTGFEKQEADFFHEAQAKGVGFTTSVDFLK